MNILKRMSRTLTEVTLRMTLFRDEQRRRLTRPESRLAARGGSGLTHVASTNYQELEEQVEPLPSLPWIPSILSIYTSITSTWKGTGSLLASLCETRHIPSLYHTTAMTLPPPFLFWEVDS